MFRKGKGKGKGKAKKPTNTSIGTITTKQTTGFPTKVVELSV